MNVLVTGADGFIGKQLVAKLSQNNKHNVIEHDINQGDIAVEPLKYENIQHVFHLAAKSFVPDSWENPLPFYQTNLLGTVNVLEFCRKNKCSSTIMSSYVYGTPDSLPINENHPLKAYNPYSHTKVLIEDTCKFYAEKFNQVISVIRPFNVYGPNQNKNFLIPSIVSQLFDETKSQIELMDLNPKRDYVFVSDLINALELTIKSKEYNTFNIGSGVSYSVGEIVEIIFKEARKSKKVVSKNIQRPNEVLDVIADISKIKNKLDWQPKITISEGILRCVEGFTKK